jgi:CDP-glycerol glycerophosphotransferase
MIEDYMLENISSNAYVLGGYPRNEVFFDTSRIDTIRETLEISDKRVYAYMPTWRGTTDKIGSAKNDAYLLYYLYEVDKLLNDDEVFYVNLHPLAQKNVKFDQFKHIQNFPSGYETYEFLNTVDVLVTDYSSVFFDFACTKKKVVLFPYDKEEYLEGRGMYMSLEDLPFPQTFDAPSLVEELRSPKTYDDTKFLEEFCPYDNLNASQQLCDYFILGEDTGLTAEKVPNNGKENVLIYAGNLDKNGITTSLRSLLNTIDCDKRNYYVSFCQKKARNNGFQLATFNPKVSFFAVAEYFNLTLDDKVNKNLFTRNMLSAQNYMKSCGKRFEQNFTRAYGNARFDRVIQFNGYENDIILLYSAFQGKKAIFVHNDMLDEIKTRGNQRRDVLNYAYNTYDKIAVVTEDIIPPTAEIKGDSENIVLVKNTINYQSILALAEEPIDVNDITKCSMDLEKFQEVMQNDSPKYINIARFSPEKGHERLVDAFYKVHQENPDTYLIVMGGNSRDRGFENLTQKVIDLGLEDYVILLLGVSNPYPILKACDYFVLSSFYEGFGLVLAEADILGKPVISTDIRGPRGFMNKYGGTLVENSEEGIVDGMRMLLEGKVQPMNVDYEAYNQTCVEEFERLIGD